MAIVVDRELCPHDHSCPLIDLCPVEAISQGADGYPTVDAERCIECQQCVAACPMRAMKQV